MYLDRKVSLIIPCLDEEQGIARVLNAVPSFIDEIIVVDNGSTDRTAQVARRLGARVISEDRRGYGRAYRTGFSAASGDIIVTMDGDMTYPVPAVAGMVVYLLDQGLDFVSGCRFPLNDRLAMPLLNRLGNRLLTLCFNLAAGTRLQDSQSGMWVFRKAILKDLTLESTGMGLSEEIKLEVLLHPSLRFAERPISYTRRMGKMKLRPWRDGLANLLLLFRKRRAIALRGRR